MNNGAFGENFPYSNFHDLNMDWIIKIAKDFLDQYTHIQEIIEQGETHITELTNTGLEELENKKDELENLLQEWYDTHSEDIENKLRTAIEDFATEVNNQITRFNQLADAKVASALASIPTDYTEMYKNYITLKTAYETDILNGENAFPLTSEMRRNHSNTDVTDNQNGTITFGNTDYGYYSVGPVLLSPGTYKLCHMPSEISNAYIYLSSTASYGQAFETNNTTEDKQITITSPVNAYLGVAILQSPPASPFTVKLYLTKTVPMSNTEDFNSYNGKYNLNNEVLDNYIAKSTNVFKPTEYTSGKYINPNGTIGTRAGYILSDYFNIKPKTDYFISNSGIDICFYDHKKEYISGLEPGINTVIRTPKNAFYARASTNVNPINWGIYEGDADTGESYFTPYLMANPYANSPYYKGRFLPLSGECGDFYTGYLSSYDLRLSYTTKYSDIITMFDRLRNEAESGYITKRSIGSAEGTDENGNPYTIYEYVFKPRNVESPIETPKHPKLLINCAIHGFEKNSTFGMYCLMYDIVKNWKQNNFLSTLHNMVEIHIVPVANPWGFDRDVYYNANNVNLNRNFPCENWQAGEHTGTAPLDQSESRALANWINSNNDMLIFIDTHTNGHYYVSSYAECNANMPYQDTNDPYYNKIFTAIKRHIERQTNYIPSILTNIDPTFVETLGRYQSQDGQNQPNGYTDLYVAFTQRSAVAMTLEGCNGINVHDKKQIPYLSANSYRLNSMIFGNMIQEILIEYCK